MLISPVAAGTKTCEERFRKGNGGALRALLTHIIGSCGTCSAGENPLPEALEGRWHVSKLP